MNRTLYFVHYNKLNGLAEYVIYLLKNIRAVYGRIVFVSNSPLCEEQRNRILEFSDEILVRENRGFDFGAWKDALLKDGWENISRYDSITLMNDSCFGPLFDIENMYLDMEQKDIDFWGLTNHRNDKHGIPGTNRPIPEHIQSYFLCFNRKTAESEAFKRFWRNMKNENNIEKVIQNYETRLTGILTGAGYKYSVLLDAYNFAARNTDISITRPDLCLKFKVPFIKIKSFVYFSYPKYTIALLKENTRYPVDFIFNYLNQVYDPDTTLFIQDKLLINGVKNTHAPPDKRAAIHLHVYYPEILDKFMILDNTNANFDLYITTDTREKKEIIYDLLKDHVCFSKLKEIIILENQGRDIVPWLSIKEILNQYDIVGHFHTKKHSLAEDWIGVTWLDDLLHSLLYDINNIFSEFHRNGSLGIIIAEVPYIFRKLFLPGFSAGFNKMLSDTWKRLKCTKTLDFSRTKNIIMPIGNMFWYRPAALKPLFEMRLPPEDIPREPIQRETILHSIEHLLVYIAWNDGYDYRISLSPNIRDSNFVDMYRVYSTADALTGSLTYRTGKFFLALPKAVLRMLRKFKP